MISFPSSFKTTSLKTLFKSLEIKWIWTQRSYNNGIKYHIMKVTWLCTSNAVRKALAKLKTTQTGSFTSAQNIKYSWDTSTMFGVPQAKRGSNALLQLLWKASPLIHEKNKTALLILLYTGERIVFEMNRQQNKKQLIDK